MNIKNDVNIIKLDDLGRGIGYVDNKIVVSLAIFCNICERGHIKS